MVSQHALALAESLIKSHFGDLVSKVCGCLLHRGSLSLPEVVRFTELSVSMARNCLIVLIQHNCVQAYSIPKPAGLGATKPVTQYMALSDNILHRLRFPKFLAIVNTDLGEQCEYLLEGLLQNGRLTFHQLVVRATSKDPGAKRKDIHENLNRLVHAKYVERCPRAEPFITLEDVSSSGRKRNSKAGAGSLSVEQQATIAAALSNAERFSEISDIGTNTILDVKETLHYPGMSVGDKRKHEAIEVDNDFQSTMTENEVLWRANNEKFVYCLKKKACVESIKSKLSLDAGIVLEAMIESSREQWAKDSTSVTSSMEDILEALKGKPGGSSMTSEHVKTILEQLGCRFFSEGTGPVYTFNLKGVIETCQNNEIEAVVLKRYGKEAYRVFRLLASKSIVENDCISGTTFIEKMAAQGILYRFWKDEYLDMKRVQLPQGTGQQNTKFLWKMNKTLLQEHILNDMYHAALNLSQLAAHMIEQDPEILSIKSLPEAQRKQKIAMQKRWMILLSSLSKLDGTIMLFHDF